MTQSPNSINTEYANTDFDLKSNVAFDSLHSELQEACSVLQYTKGEDGNWHAVFEAKHNEDSRDRDAAMDILLIVEALESLSEPAKMELEACFLREFNIGFHCGDSWAYEHHVPQDVVRSVADSSCSIAVTLFPMRNQDGTSKMES